MLVEKNKTSLLVPSILFEDESILILFKPASWFVHPPENPKHRRGLKRKTCVQWLMDQHQIKASPAHRIDVPTEGLLIFGKTKLATSHLNLQFKNQTVKKTYQAVVRGWLPKLKDEISLPLELDSTGELVPCLTAYQTKSCIEQNFTIHPKFSTSRYSFLEVKPLSGRWHQIRRHMNRVSHPIIGDREHGDSRHNRYFREQLNIEGLCLRAYQIEFLHPTSLVPLIFTSPHTLKWQIIFDLFKIKK